MAVDTQILTISKKKQIEIHTYKNDLMGLILKRGNQHMPIAVSELNALSHLSEDYKKLVEYIRGNLKYNDIKELTK